MTKSTDHTPELKPCPFCGGPAGRISVTARRFGCVNRECPLECLLGITAEQWNQRDPALTKAREAMEGLVRRCLNDEMSDEIPELIKARAALALMKGGAR